MPLEKGLVQTPDALPSVEAKLHTNGEVQHAGELSAFLQLLLSGQRTGRVGACFWFKLINNMSCHDMNAD